MTKPMSREPLPGFPVEPYQMTIAQIEQYLADDKILCLVCGRSYRNLDIHLAHLHEIDDDDYRQRFGLRWGDGLVSKESQQRYSEAKTSDPKQMQRMRDLAKKYQPLVTTARHRTKSPSALEPSLERLKTINGREEDFPKEQFIAALKANRTLIEALADLGYSKSEVHAVKRKDRAFREAIKAAIEAQPFEVQARGHALGRRFPVWWSRLTTIPETCHAVRPAQAAPRSRPCR